MTALDAGMHQCERVRRSGHDHGRVAEAYAKFVAEQGFVFRHLGPAEGHHDGVRIRWKMVPAAGGDAASGGVQFLLLDAASRVQSDYQFIDF